MSSQELSAVAGIALSLAFSYVPGLKDKFDALDSTQKRLVMAVLLMVIAFAPFAVNCGSALLAKNACDTSAFSTVVSNLIAALVANQSAYLISPKPDHAA